MCYESSICAAFCFLAQEWPLWAEVGVVSGQRTAQCLTFVSSDARRNPAAPVPPYIHTLCHGTRQCPSTHLACFPPLSSVVPCVGQWANSRHAMEAEACSSYHASPAPAHVPRGGCEWSGHQSQDRGECHTEQVKPARAQKRQRARDTTHAPAAGA